MKNVAVAYLRLHFGCAIAAMEVWGMGDEYNPVNGKETKYVADAVGIRIRDKWTPLSERREPDNPYERVETIYCIEVKVSRNDCKSGYCIGGDLNYVMTPKGLVAKDEVYKGIGLIEADLDNLEFTKGWGLRGIEIIKRPTRRKANGKNQRWIDWVFREMSSRLTLNSIKYNPWFYFGWEGAEARLTSQG